MPGERVKKGMLWVSICSKKKKKKNVKEREMYSHLGLQKCSSLEDGRIPPSNAWTPPRGFETPKYEASFALALPVWPESDQRASP